MYTKIIIHYILFQIKEPNHQDQKKKKKCKLKRYVYKVKNF